MFASSCLNVLYEGYEVCNKWHAEWSLVAYEVKKAFLMAS